MPATAEEQANPARTEVVEEQPAGLSSLLSEGVLEFDLGDLGDSDDEGLPTGKNLKPFWAEIAKGISMEEWRTKMKKAMDREPKLKWVGKLLLDAILSLKTALGNFARTHANPEELPPDNEPRAHFAPRPSRTAWGPDADPPCTCCSRPGGNLH